MRGMSGTGREDDSGNRPPRKTRRINIPQGTVPGSQKERKVRSKGRKRTELVRNRPTTTVRFPAYLDEAIRAWLDAHPGHTKTSMIMIGLATLGLPVADADKIPRKVARRK